MREQVLRSARCRDERNGKRPVALDSPSRGLAGEAWSCTRWPGAEHPAPDQRRVSATGSAREPSAPIAGCSPSCRGVDTRWATACHAPAPSCSPPHQRCTCGRLGSTIHVALPAPCWRARPSCCSARDGNQLVQHGRSQGHRRAGRSASRTWLRDEGGDPLAADRLRRRGQPVLPGRQPDPPRPLPLDTARHAPRYRQPPAEPPSRTAVASRRARRPVRQF